MHVVTHVSVAPSQTCPAAHVGAPGAHAFAASSHVSVPSHATPSSQTRAAPPHVVPAHTSPSVQKSPSSQLAPSFALHALRVTATLHV